MEQLLTLAARCATAAAGLLTGPAIANQDVRFLADGYLKMARELLECSYLPEPYLWHVQVTCWAGVEYWYKWLAGDDLTAAQADEHAALAEAWAALLAAWDAAQGADEEAA